MGEDTAENLEEPDLSIRGLPVPPVIGLSENLIFSPPSLTTFSPVGGAITNFLLPVTHVKIGVFGQLRTVYLQGNHPAALPLISPEPAPGPVPLLYRNQSTHRTATKTMGTAIAAAKAEEDRDDV